MTMKFFIYLSLFIFFYQISNANESSKWLESEINTILDTYKNENISNENRFLIIEDTVNNNFAGTGIAKFVSGVAWTEADVQTKKKYIAIFKKHLALNIASMMQSYSNQEFELTNNQYDEKNKVSLIDMTIMNENNNIIVTWRVKKSKDRFYIIDLLVADISLVVTKRSEFNSMLKNIGNDLKVFNNILNNQNVISYNKLIN